MRFEIEENFENRKGVVSNCHGFLSAYLDGGFKEKWDGYWSPNYKYLDYFASKTNGEWLTGENLEEAKYGDQMKLIHRISNLKTTQKITCPDNIPGFKLEYHIENVSESIKAVKTSIETGIDIRPRTEDIGSQEYTIKSRDIGMKIENSGKWVAISSNNFKFERDENIKEHYPGEKQKCLVPGNIIWKTEVKPGETKKAEILFKTDGETNSELNKSVSRLKNSDLSHTFNESVQSLENLFYGKNGSGIIAGHPWFQNYWARDSFWSALGMIDAGMFKEVEKILLNFSNSQIPSMIRTDGTEETEYPRSDTLPLYAIAAEKLERHYKPNQEIIETANKLLKEEKPEGKIVQNHEDGTWMDTLKREKAIDIQSLWIEALERYGMDNRKLKEGLKEFEQEDYMKDNLQDNFESINPALPIMFNQLNKKELQKYLEKINAEFSSRYGARTRSATDPGYQSDGYHEGSVWGLTTCWAAAANLEQGNKRHGLNFLKKITQFTDRNQLGALPELVDAESGENLGCNEQAWSAGMFIHVIDTYLLGIKVKNPNKVLIDPVKGLNITRKNKKIGGQKIDIHLKNGKIEIPDKKDLNIEKVD